MAGVLSEDDISSPSHLLTTLNNLFLTNLPSSVLLSSLLFNSTTSSASTGKIQAHPQTLLSTLMQIQKKEEKENKIKKLDLCGAVQSGGPVAELAIKLVALLRAENIDNIHTISGGDAAKKERLLQATNKYFEEPRFTEPPFPLFNKTDSIILHPAGIQKLKQYKDSNQSLIVSLS